LIKKRDLSVFCFSFMFVRVTFHNSAPKQLLWYLTAGEIGIVHGADSWACAFLYNACLCHCLFVLCLMFPGSRNVALFC